ncbi:helix-turn-helix domain-containing protein [Salinicoccus sp. ID82-1]|uniref:helix-turn-helix domain-containing protein n=1 Tax=Salinicoccus sp. ID82-1 TaxID=2820269 RepID=UPI001F3BB22E|nr:RodZ domain-containing protein [Salinicoccus sp. ID82-1]MCG1008747.1 helix-turn-helix domain-containing protein [Salinicoccus sp. ID82-1]
MKLGAYLKNKREQSGITLKEMQEKSGIRKEIIRLIESDDLGALPEPAHAPFLLQQYTRAVGLDSNAIMERYADALPDDNLNERKRHQSQNEDYQYFKKVLISFLVLVGVLFVGWMVLLQVGAQTDLFEKKPIYSVKEDLIVQPDESETASSEPAEQTVEAPTEEPTEAPATDYSYSGSEGSTFYYDLHVVEPLVISLAGEDTSWVTLTDDAGNTYAYENLTEGEFEISPEASIVYLTLGDSTGFNVRIDGEPLENPEAGSAVTVYYEFNLVKEE